eukprot:10090287-Ditylum_brightwellii.AAC.1
MEWCALAKYVVTGNNPITQIVRDTPSLTQKHLLMFASDTLFHMPDLTDTMHHKVLYQKPFHSYWCQKQVDMLQVDLEQ